MEGWRRGELRGLLRSFFMANVSSSLLEGVEVILICENNTLCKSTIGGELKVMIWVVRM